MYMPRGFHGHGGYGRGFGAVSVDGFMRRFWWISDLAAIYWRICWVVYLGLHCSRDMDMAVILGRHYPYYPYGYPPYGYPYRYGYYRPILKIKKQMEPDNWLPSVFFYFGAILGFFLCLFRQLLQDHPRQLVR